MTRQQRLARTITIATLLVAVIVTAKIIPRHNAEVITTRPTTTTTADKSTTTTNWMVDFSTSTTTLVPSIGNNLYTSLPSTTTGSVAGAPLKKPRSTTPPRTQPSKSQPQSPTKAPTNPHASSTTTTRPPTTTATTALPEQWNLAWEEQFGNSEQFAADWGLYDGIGNGGVGFRRPSHVSVADNLLTITGTKADLTGGGLASKASATYGRWEWRVRVDAGTGWGPAIMLWPDSERWPEDGEIDVMESPTGAHDFVVSTLHWGQDNQQMGVDTAIDATQWQTYAVEWLPNRLTIFVDGVAVLNTTNAAAIPTTPHHVAMQLDVGANGEWIPAPDATTPETVKMQVDWVKAYQLGG